MPDARPARHNLFLALLPDAATRDAIAAAAAALRCARGDIGRWIRPPRYHMTLRFLGVHSGLPAATVRRATDVAARVRCAGFAFQLDVVGTFGARRVPVWLGCSTAPPPLRALHDALADAADPAVAASDAAQAFVPHVTILRDAARPLRERLPVPIPWRADEFVLVDSEPPATYRVVGRWALRG